jgi:hypothetical protein
MQIARMGVSEADVVSIVTDGGGENEGYQGLHRFYELLDPLYVRRRGVEHISWRVVIAGLKALGTKPIDLLASYLHDGVTWTRLQAIATQPRATGGLALFALASEEFANIFRPRPPCLVDGRPTCYYEFLRWLLPRECTLHKLTAVDLTQRKLEAAAAVKSFFGSTIDSVKRMVGAVLVRKGLDLHDFALRKLYLVEYGGFTKIVDDAVARIMDLTIDEDLWATLCTKIEDVDLQSLIADIGVADIGTSWVDVGIIWMGTSYGWSGREIEAMLPDAMAFHADM